MAIHAVNRRRRRPSRRASALLVVAAVAAASSHASLLAYAASGHAPSGRRGARAGFVQPLVHKGPHATATGRAAAGRRVPLTMAAGDGQGGAKKKGGLGSFLRRTLGGALAVVGLSAAPLRKETLDLFAAPTGESLQQAAAAETLQEKWASTWQGLSDGFAAAAGSLPEGNDYEMYLGQLADKAGEYMNGVYDWASPASAVVQEKGAELAAALDGRVEAVAQSLGDLLGEAAGSVPALGDSTASQEAVRSLAAFLKQAAVNPAARLQTEEALGALVVGGLTLAAAKSLLGPALGEAPGSLLSADGRPPAEYDGALIDAYYKARPGKVLARLVAALSDSSSYLGGLLLDYVTGTSEANAPKRAKQVTTLITELGPVFIKVAQLLSVRPDIIGPVYLKELRTLQDQVKSFSSKEAQAIIAANLPKGTTLADVYENPDRDFQTPVAAASLGQVYRAVLKDGTAVAVKVQRPQMLENITLDLYTLRLVMNVGARVGNARIKRQCRSFIEVLDNWGGRFIQELDYEQEAVNSRNFFKAMNGNPLVSENIIVPRVFDEISTRYVLVTEWVEGRKISAFNKDDPKDRERLEQIVAVLLNSYLIQLLETGFLHADPHAGNFLITNDGRLAILDHGLITEIKEEQRIALVQYVAHLLGKDYEATVDDLVKLGFLPKELADDATNRNIVAPVLGAVLEQLSNGGGAKAAKRIKVEDIGDEVKALSKKYPLSIPPWFGLIVRTFSALEGLGLGLDGNYSIVNQCFPYLSRRLLTDDDPRIRAALKSFLYGKDQQLKVERVNDMLGGYRNFTVAFDSFQGVAALPSQAPVAPVLSTAGPAGSGPGRTALTYDRATMEALQILFHKDGNFVQELVVDEMVRMTDAAVKETTQLFARRAKATPLALAGFFRQPPTQLLPSPLRNAVLLPFFPLIAFLGLFAALAERAESLSQLTEEDKESLKTLRLLLSLVTQRGEEVLQQQQQQAGGNGNAAPGLPFPFPPFPIPVPSPFGTGNRRGGLPFPFPPFPFPLPGGAGGAGGRDRFLETTLDMSAGIMQLLPEVAPGMAQIGRRFLAQLTGRILNRLADELEKSSTSSSTTLF